MSTIVRGQTSVVEGPSTYTSNSDGSGTTVRTFNGNQAEVISLETSLRAQGYSTLMEQGTPWRMTATLAYNIVGGGNEPEPESTWTITSNAGEQNILESDILMVRNLSTGTKERILMRLKNPGKDIPLFPLKDETGKTIPVTAADYNNAHGVYNRMKIGADSKRLITKTVSRTITVSKNYVSNWDLRHEGKVLSKATLASSTGMPNWVYVLCPDSGYVTVDSTTNIRGFKGYLEEGANRQSVANNQVQISNTWIFNTWLSDYYDIV